MQFVSLKSQLWIGLILVSLHLWGRLSASSPHPALAVPTLDIYSRSADSSVLVCRAPNGHRGIQFTLFKMRDKVDSREQPLGAEEVHFTVRLSDSSQYEFYCCMYKTEEGSFSAFSPYLKVDRQRDADPTRPISPHLKSPVLSMVPSNGLVKRGDMLSFHCTLPPPLPQYHTNSVSFMLLRGTASNAKEITSIVPQPQSSQVTIPEPQPGVFNVGPVTGAEQGQYSCLYQINRGGGGLLNSTVSNVVHVTVKDLLPTPTLVLQQQSDVWQLLCRGWPSYPGALFSLYLEDHEHPVTTHRTTVTQHQAVFSVPVQDTPVALYQCDYRVLLGREWSKSERSPALLVSQGSSSTPKAVSSGVDWPLVLGSLSAVVLFLCSMVLITVVLHRKVKAAAEAEKKRVEAQFWTHVHGKDHVVDLTLHRGSFTSQDWTSGHTESGSQSQMWNPVSTFTPPISSHYGSPSYSVYTAGQENPFPKFPF